MRHTFYRTASLRRRGELAWTYNRNLNWQASHLSCVIGGCRLRDENGSRQPRIPLYIYRIDTRLGECQK
jgi:hypothetical protein